MKTEIIHFTDAPEMKSFAEVKVFKNDNAYGVTWANLVREYLKTAYLDESAEAEVISYGVTYRVLKRDGVTAFYDADGNTLFDVENKRLEKEYGLVMDVGSETVAPAPSGGEPEGQSRDDTPAGKDIPVDAASVKQRAIEKLEKELKGDKAKDFAEAVIGYLLKRCEEDEGLAQDVVQEHKTWEKCCDYIYKMAKRQAPRKRAAVREKVVYEWAEYYYRKDDKAEEEKRAKEVARDKVKKEKVAAERKNTGTGKAKETSAQKKAETPKKEKAPKEPNKPKRNGNDMDGQLDMFSMMGM